MSDDARKVALEVERIEPHRLVMIRNGVDTSKVCPGDGTATRRELGVPDDAFHIGCVARLSAEKDDATLLLALSILRARLPHARLTPTHTNPLGSSLPKNAVQMGRASLRFDFNTQMHVEDSSISRRR